MRILYGKFHSHESTHTSKKDTKSNKRGIIIQFLSSCNENELYYFFDLLFGCIYKVIKDETNQIESINLDDSEKINTFITNLQIKLSNYYGENTYYTLNNIIPLKKLLGVLDSLEIIIKKLARRMEHFSHRLLQILCFIHKYSLTLYEMGNSNIIDEKQNQYEYLFVFDSFIWPLSLKLKNESLKSVSNLLKIFSLWSERSFYYPLFVINLQSFDSIDSSFIAKSVNTNFQSKSILDVLFELIDTANCSKLVIDYVLDIVYNLVTFADFKPDENIENEQEHYEQGNFITKPLPFEVDNKISEYSIGFDKSSKIFLFIF